ncbi:MAG: leucyl aminopeptidase [Acidobacteria bacterium]|nr:leucyl aminopeptidase [Acidobacteriota bacterium]
MTRLLEPNIAGHGALKRGTLALGCLEDRPLPATGLTPEVVEAIHRAVKARGWKGKAEHRLQLSVADDAVTVTLHGLGKAADLDCGRLWQWLDAVAEHCTASCTPELLVVPPSHGLLKSPHRAAALLRWLGLTSYVFDEFRQAPPSPLRRLRLLPPEGMAKTFRGVRKTAAAVARGVALARDLANTPPNRATPAWMASRARSLARRVGAKARVLGPKELRRLDMGALLAVGQGSANTPRLVRLELGTRGPVIALVGKGVTFDTGGISIKPSAAMDEMKYDKAGACTVLGAVQAIAELGLRVRLRAYLPLAENMPGGRAYRPGDIVRMRGGKTVEVLNTDAEGRLVLADAISLAVEEKPDALLEFSTLTGATVVALGHHGAAIYTPDDRLAHELLGAADESGERLWRMPLWREFGDEMKGRHADLRNVAGRWGGANTAASFLAEFMGDCESWAHVDIAGTAWVPAEQGAAFGATGYGVATTVTWLLDRLGAG